MQCSKLGLRSLIFSEFLLCHFDIKLKTPPP